MSGRTAFPRGNSRCEGRACEHCEQWCRRRGILDRSVRERPFKRLRATKWSFHRERRNSGRTSRRSVSCSPCFISVSLGTPFEARTLPRRCPCSRWAREHGTTRHCQSSTPRRPSRRHPRRRRMPSKRSIRRGCTSRQRIWPPPGDGAALGYSRPKPPAGDAAAAWARGVTCRDPPSSWTRGRSRVPLLNEFLATCYRGIHS